MGRYDFRPARIYDTTARLLAASKLPSAPPWFDAVGSNPPSQILVRTLPVQQSEAGPTRQRRKKASKLYRPQAIQYEEDALRRTFFSDHPWELARPRVVLEKDGRDYQDQDWSTASRPGRPVTGEGVVQRQLWLMHNVRGMSKSAAYDQARKEFYEQRLEEEVERRVAKEEALAVGAYFGKSRLQVGMELEDKAYDEWRLAAIAEHDSLRQLRAAAVQTTLEAPPEEEGEAAPEEPAAGGAEASEKS